MKKFLSTLIISTLLFIANLSFAQNSDEAILVQLNNLQIKEIKQNPEEGILSTFIVTKPSLGFTCQYFPDEESKPRPCPLKLRRNILKSLRQGLKVNISEETELLDINRENITIQDFQVGDKINVYGELDKQSYEIDALIVRRIEKGKIVPPPVTGFIKVLSPNGGEGWQIGTKQTIRWTTINIPATNLISIGLRNTYSLVDYPLLDTPNDGNETIVVPYNIPAGIYLLFAKTKVKEIVIYDWSDAPFNIYDRTGAPFILSLSSSQGLPGTEIIIYGERFLTAPKTNDILWDGSAIRKISSPDGKTLSFAVPSTARVGWHSIQVKNENGVSNKVGFEVPSVPVPAPSITVLSPNGGEKWQLGDTHTILWTPYSYNPDINPSYQVTAYLEKLVNGNFVTVGKIVECGKASIHWDGSLDTCGSNNYPEPGDYYVRVVNNVTGASDRSDKPFTLVAKGTLKADLKINGSDGPITIPEGGATYTISWTSNTEKCSIYFHNSDPHTRQENLAPSGSMSMKLLPNTNWYIDSISLACSSQTPIEGSASDYVQILPLNTSVTVVSPNGGEAIDFISYLEVLNGYVFSIDVKKFCFF